MEIYRMNDLLKVLFLISILQCCNSPKKESQNEEKSDSITVQFNYDQSPAEFRVSDSTGFDLTFHKNSDSIVYTYFRFRAPESKTSLVETLPSLAGMWRQAESKIDIRLNSINVGYPLEYNDVLTRQIQTFAGSAKWQNQQLTPDQKINYRLVEEIMSGSDIYPLDELLTDFGYELIGISVEKVGVIEPERLVGLGYNESLSIPMPYMVWINVEKKD